MAATRKLDETGIGLRKSRLESLCDGVFSVALTILALDLVVPRNTGPVPDSVLRGEFVSLAGPLFVVLLGFVVVGAFWLGNNLIFHWIDHTDRYFIWLTLLYLFAVIILPFSTFVLAAYPTHQAATLFFGLNQLAAGLIASASWAYGGRFGLLSRRADPHTRQYVQRRLLIGPAVTVIGIGASFVYPLAGLAVYATIIVLYLIPSHVDAHLRQGDQAHAGPL